VFPSVPTIIEGGSFKFAGKIKTDNVIEGKQIAQIKINYGFGTSVKFRKSVTLISNGRISNSGLVSRLWAQVQINELQLFPEIDNNNDKILSLGKQYNIVTPSTSFIVLEKLEQYITYEIEPPVALAELHKKWVGAMEEKKTKNGRKKRRKNSSGHEFLE